ncbi:MAG: FtsX-like permease family protein, partial [Phycisphaerae bacterium]
MNLARLVARSLRFHWRSHVGVVLGSAVAATVLVGALVVGDSVRGSLARMARARLGGTHLAVVGGNRFFRDALADDLARDLGVPAAAIIQVGGIAARADGTDRVNQAQVIGADAAFWRLGGAAEPLLPDAGRNAVAVNAALVERLNVREGDRLVVRLAEADTVPADVPLSGERGTAIALRPTIRAVAGADAFGRFSLAANQVPPHNVYLPRARLQAVLEVEGRANLLLIGARTGDSNGSAARRVSGPAATNARKRGGYGDPPRSVPTVEEAEAALRRVFRLADGGLDLVPRPERGAVDLTTRRVFLDPPVSQAAARRDDAVGILTYLVNDLRIGDRATPYSMVTAVGPLATDLTAEARQRLATHLPAGLADLADDEILLNAWLADDLAAEVGDEITLTYYVPSSAGRIETASATFRVGGIVPIEGAAADATLMPPFPGVSDKADCSQWEPGVPIDLDRIRDKDETYWDEYGGTPKAFLRLSAGRRIWANRFGDATAVRFVGGSGEAYEEEVRTALRDGLDPGALGLFVEPVRARARAAAGQALDFGQLFLALSMFLIAAALVLTGLLFAFSTQRRAAETGTLLAVGYRPRRVRRLMLAEGAVLVTVGTLLGTAGGLAYTRLVLVGLATVWRSAVGASEIRFHAEPASLLIGAAAGVVVALVTIRLTLRRQGRAPARELLASGAEADLGAAAATVHPIQGRERRPAAAPRSASAPDANSSRAGARPWRRSVSR